MSVSVNPIQNIPDEIFKSSDFENSDILDYLKFQLYFIAHYNLQKDLNANQEDFQVDANDIFCRTQHLASSIKLKLQMDKYKNYFLSKLDSVLSNLSDTEKDTISYYKLIIKNDQLNMQTNHRLSYPQFAAKNVFTALMENNSLNCTFVKKISDTIWSVCDGGSFLLWDARVIIFFEFLFHLHRFLSNHKNDFLNPT